MPPDIRRYNSDRNETYNSQTRTRHRSALHSLIHATPSCSSWPPAARTTENRKQVQRTRVQRGKETFVSIQTVTMIQTTIDHVYRARGCLSTIRGSAKVFKESLRQSGSVNSDLESSKSDSKSRSASASSTMSSTHFAHTSKSIHAFRTTSSLLSMLLAQGFGLPTQTRNKSSALSGTSPRERQEVRILADCACPETRSRGRFNLITSRNLGRSGLQGIIAFTMARRTAL